MHRFFTDFIGEEKPMRRSHSISDSTKSQLKSPAKQEGLKRDYSQARGHNKFNSQYEPMVKDIKYWNDPNNAKSVNKSVKRHDEVISVKKAKLPKEKQKIKNSYINIDNVQKRIYPKKPKGSKKLKESKKSREKISSRSKQSSTISHNYESHWSKHR